MKIIPYQEKYRAQVISVWEKSVRATHSFVTLSDIDFFKHKVEELDFTSFSVYCLMDHDKVIGFIGVSDHTIETLFVDPDFIGKGHGLALMNYALKELNAYKVEVNEQNKEAVKFYTKFGFKTYERTDKDGYGKEYPVLKMKLSSFSEKK